MKLLFYYMKGGIEMFPMMAQAYPDIIKQKSTETRLIEVELGYDSFAWECEECKNLWTFENGSPEENSYNYCSNCGRKVEEYVEFVEED